MGWMGKFFGGGGASIAALRKAVEQKRFADARLLAEQLVEQGGAEAEPAELRELQAAAGDGLARLNLNEALGFRRSGEEISAREHLELALELACSTDLRTEIEQLLTADKVELTTAPLDEMPAAVDCSSCGPQPSTASAATDTVLPDLETHLELVLMSYPEDIAAQYRQKGEIFLQAFLHSNAGDDEAALPLWQQVPASEQDALYHFEYGSALARSGRSAEARSILEKARQLDPELLLVSEALIPVLVTLGETAAARQYLQDLLDQGVDPAFCHAHLALLSQQEQQPDQALKHVRQALAGGIDDPHFLLVAASLLEQAGSLEETEAVLQRFPAGGGCGGGLSMPLAEFLLRQKRELEKVLDTFNAACRQEPDNPRWQLRVAQTYIARTWRKEGLELLQKVVGDPRLEPELQQEAEQLLAALKG